MSELIFKGVATALVTPFDKENKVEYGKLEELIEYQISQGATRSSSEALRASAPR